MKPSPSHSARGRGRGAALACALVLAAALPSCGGVDGPIQVLVAAYDPSEGGYRHVVANIRTLKNLSRMEGDAVYLLGGAEIVEDYDELARERPQTLEEVAAITQRKRGRPVNFAWFESGGVVYPEDFHSLAMATIYFNFEKAQTYFRAVGASLPSLPVLYQPTFRAGPSDDLQEITDNAYWDRFNRTFAVLPFRDIQELPLGMNAGVIAHEYSHAVFSHLVFPEEDEVPWLLQRYLEDRSQYSRAMNYVASVDEGIADYFGAVVSGDPAFFRKSFSEHAEDRRLDPPEPRCMTAAMREAAEKEPHETYDPYPIGSVLSAALWEGTRAVLGREADVARSLVKGMSELQDRYRQREHRIDLATSLNGLVGEIDNDLRPSMCGLFIDRFGLAENELPGCVAPRLPEVRCAR